MGLTIIASVGAIIIAAELQAWLPAVSRLLLARAVRKLSLERRERYEEEWAAHIDELPGSISKVLFALQLFIASNAIERQAKSGSLDATAHWSWRTKIVFDFAAAALALLFLSPMLLTIALAIRLDNNGYVLHRLRCHGQNGQVFDLFKFRIFQMEKAETSAGMPVFKVTKFGAFLRYTSLDELPMLINVVRGEMSLIGPRPQSPYMLVPKQPPSAIGADRERRFRVKPGINGLAQIARYSGKKIAEEDFGATDDPDLYYIDHWSFWLDVRILYHTAFACFGAAPRTKRPE